MMFSDQSIQIKLSNYNQIIYLFVILLSSPLLLIVYFCRLVFLRPSISPTFLHHHTLFYISPITWAHSSNYYYFYKSSWNFGCYAILTLETKALFPISTLVHSGSTSYSMVSTTSTIILFF